jgi:hypothetical protein
MLSQFVKPRSDTLLPYFNMFHLAPSPSSLQFTELYLVALLISLSYCRKYIRVLLKLCIHFLKSLPWVHHEPPLSLKPYECFNEPKFT